MEGTLNDEDVDDYNRHHKTPSMSMNGAKEWYATAAAAATPANLKLNAFKVRYGSVQKHLHHLQL